MSEQHAARLQRVLLERDAAVEALEKAARYSIQTLIFYISDSSDLQRAAENAADTYYFRLIADLEGMLFRHRRWFRFASRTGESMTLYCYCLP